MMRIVWLTCLFAACGGRVPQAAECGTYVQCVRAMDTVLQRTTNVDRFLADGACWSNGDTGELCETGCRRGLDWLRAHQTSVPQECLR